MLIKNKTVRLFNFGKKMKLIPGMNDVSKWKKHDLESIKGQLEELEKRDLIEMPKLEIDDDFAEGLLTPLNAGDAIAVVKETFDYDKLKELEAEEKAEKARATVLKALENQIAISEDALKPSEE